tara:strand:- start:812 stop:1204 length:393 start_codon:yes stop_codon:yes gene_type:complete
MFGHAPRKASPRRYQWDMKRPPSGHLHGIRVFHLLVKERKMSPADANKFISQMTGSQLQLMERYFKFGVSCGEILKTSHTDEVIDNISEQTGLSPRVVIQSLTKDNASPDPAVIKALNDMSNQSERLRCK